jgi:hypothetical protein
LTLAKLGYCGAINDFRWLGGAVNQNNKSNMAGKFIFILYKNHMHGRIELNFGTRMSLKNIVWQKEPVENTWKQF